MAKGNDVSTTIVLEGEKQYRDAIKGINQSLKVNQTETEKLIALYAKESGSVQALTAKQESLVSTISEQKNKVSTLAGAVDLAAQKYGEADKRTQNWQIELNKAQAELYKLENALDETNASLDRASAGSAEYEAALDGINQEMSGMSAVAQKAFDSFIEGAKEGQLSLGGVWDSIKEGMASTGAAADGMGGLIAGALSGGPVLAAAGLTAAIAKIAWEGKQVAVEFESSMVSMQNALGLTTEEAKEAAKAVKDVYKSGIADSQEEAQEAVRLVMKYLKLSGDEAEIFAEKLLLLGGDAEETAGTIHSLSKVMEISYIEAMDMIAAGYQKIAAPNDQILDQFHEFGVQFSSIGFSAEETFNVIRAGMDEGAFDINKMGDGIKTFVDGVTEGNADMAEAFEALGLNADRTREKLLSGGEVANKEFKKIIQNLNNVSDTSEKAQITAALFGSQWSDIREIIVTAMSEAESSVVSYDGTINEMYKNQLTSSENIQKQAQRTSEEIGKQALNVGSYLLGPFRGLYDAWTGTQELFAKMSVESKLAGEDVGSQIGAGAIQGLREKQAEFEKVSGEFVKASTKSMKEAGQIHSPSKLTEKEVGYQLAAGVDVGWDKGMEETFRNMRHSFADDMEMLRTLPGGFGADAGRTASSSSSTTEIVDSATYNFNIDNLDTLKQAMKWIENRRISRRQGYVGH